VTILGAKAGGSGDMEGNKVGIVNGFSPETGTGKGLVEQTRQGVGWLNVVQIV
jgi:hypothetical protein